MKTLLIALVLTLGSVSAFAGECNYYLDNEYRPDRDASYSDETQNRVVESLKTKGFVRTYNKKNADYTVWFSARHGDLLNSDLGYSGYSSASITILKDEIQIASSQRRSETPGYLVLFQKEKKLLKMVEKAFKGIPNCEELK